MPSHAGPAFTRPPTQWTLAPVVALWLALPAAAADDARPPPGWKVEQRVQGELEAGVAGEVLVLVSEQPNADGDHPRMLWVVEVAPGGARTLIARGEQLLLCVECFGALGGTPRVRIERFVLIVEQQRGSRETVEGTWRFRREKATGRIRMIGLDVQRWDRATGVGASESTNLLTGKRVDETLAFDPASGRDLVTGSNRSAVSAPKVYMEDAKSSVLD